MRERFGKIDLDVIVTLALMVAGCALMSGGIRLKIGTVSIPEPGFFPFIAGTAVAALSLCHLIGRALHQTTREAAAASRADERWWKAAALAAALAAYAAVLEPLGFVLATFLLCVAVMRIAHPQSWLVTMAVSAALSVGCFFFFKVLLRVSLPAGALV